MVVDYGWWSDWCNLFVVPTVEWADVLLHLVHQPGNNATDYGALHDPPLSTGGTPESS
jgi:hypothetical protein